MKTGYRARDRLESSILENDMNAKFKFPRGGAKRLTVLMQKRKETKGWTLAILAKHSDNLNPTYASTFNSGRQRGISVKTLFRLATGLGMDPMALAQHVFHGEAAAALPVKVEDVAVEVITPEQQARESLSERGVIMAIDGVQLVAEQTNSQAAPAIVEHAGWRMTLIPK